MQSIAESVLDCLVWPLLKLLLLDFQWFKGQVQPNFLDPPRVILEVIYAPDEVWGRD